MKKNLQNIILLYFIYVNTCLAQSAKHYYLDVSYFNKLEYASLQKATFERTDYYYKLSKNQQIILRSYPTFKRLSELPEPRLEPTAVDAFLKDLKQNKQLDSTEVFVVEKSGDSYLIFAIKNWAIVYEDEQRISYQHPKLNFEYSKSKTSNSAILNPSNNRNYAVFYTGITNYNCIDVFQFESIPHCHKEAAVPIIWLSGIGFYSLREDEHQLQLKQVNRLPLNEYLQQKCGYFEDDLKIAPTTLYVASTSNILNKAITGQAAKGILAVARSGFNSKKQTVKPTEIALENKQGIYTVQYRDCLYSISRQFNISINRLIDLNQLDSYDIVFNQKIKVIDDPNIPRQKRYPIIKIDELTGSKTIIHLAQQGQTLYGIAQFYNLSLPQLYAMNHHLKGGQLDINQHLVVGILSE